MRTRLRIPATSFVKDVKPGRGVKLKRVHRKAYLIKDRGAPGRTPVTQQWATFESTLHGWAKDKPEAERHNAVMATVHSEGVNTTKRKLVQLANITTDRETKAKARADFEWLRRKYPPKSK